MLAVKAVSPVLTVCRIFRAKLRLPLYLTPGARMPPKAGAKKKAVPSKASAEDADIDARLAAVDLAGAAGVELLAA